MKLFKSKKQISKEEEQKKILADNLAKQIDCQNKVEEAYLLNSILTEGRYVKIDNMYDAEGKQWTVEIDGIISTRLANYSKLEHNFIADTVDRWTSFIGGNPPTILVKNKSEISIEYDISELEEDVEIDENEVEAIQKIIWNILRSNKFRSLFLKLAFIQSKYGRVIPFVYLEDKKDYPTIELLKPHDNWPVFDSRNYQDLLYIVGRKATDTEALIKKYGGEFSADAMDKETEQGAREKTYIYKILTDKEQITYAGKRILKIVKHNYGRVPAFVAYNRITPFSPVGKNDVEHIFKDQKAYNITYSDIVDAIEDHIVGKRLIKKPGLTTDMNRLQDRTQRHCVVGPECEVQDLVPSLKIKDAIDVLRVISTNIEDQTGITELLKGRFSGSIATGVALSGLSRGIQDLAISKIANLSEMLEEVLNFCLFILKNSDKKEPTSKKSYKEIINRDYYPLDFVWENASIQDDRIKATTNIDLVNAGLKSRMTAMKDMKVNYPEDEQSRVSYEKLNPLINPEMIALLASRDMQNQSFSEEEENFKSKQENARMLKGFSAEVTETSPGQHNIHKMNHEKGMKMSRGKAKKLFEEHIKKHDQGLNSSPAQNMAMPGSQMMPNPKGALPGMGNEQVRPKAQPGVGNPQL